MSELIAIGTGSETIHGSYLDAVAHVEPSLGERYDAWVAANETTRKKSLVNAVRYLNSLPWDEEADTFAKREAIVVDGRSVFHVAQYELAVLAVEDSTVTDAANQGSNIQSMQAGSASLTFFNSTLTDADPMPPILMRLVGQYLAASSSGPIGGSGAGGGSKNPLSQCADFDRGEPY